MFFCNWSSTSSSKSHSTLETVINPPLESSQSTYHENSCSKTPPKSGHSNLGINLFHVFTQGTLTFNVVQLRDHCVCRVWYYSTENSGTIPWSKSYGQLGSFWILTLRFGIENMHVEFLNYVLKCHKFHHGVGHLSAPQRYKSFK